MDEQDWATPWVAGLNKVQLYATAACDLVVLHQLPPVVTLLPIPWRLASTYQPIC
jgi:hypothetical protein